MPIFELEYTLCLIQSGIFSFARRSHREEGGNPALEIDLTSENVLWRLVNIDGGELETTRGAPRVDRIDFYFRMEGLTQFLASFPAPTARADPTLKFLPVTSAGTERRDGKRVRIAVPVCRFFPITDIKLFAHTPTPFEAAAPEGTLHMDIETGPKSIYGTEIFEIHLGVECDYRIQGLSTLTSSSAQFNMTFPMYATILSEMRGATL